MGTIEYPRLCGGVFFSLLTEARKQRISSRKKIGGISDGLSDPEMMLSLIRVVLPTYKQPHKDSFKGSTSSYKNCRRDGGEYIPFQNESFQKEMNRQAQEENGSLLYRMDQFLTQYIYEPNGAIGDYDLVGLKLIRLVCSLIVLIRMDKDIPLDTKFQILPSEVHQNNGASQIYTITKEALEGNDFADGISIAVQPFLLSVFCYIVMNCPDNTVGAGTYEWLKLPKQKEAIDALINRIAGAVFLLEIQDTPAPKDGGRSGFNADSFSVSEIAGTLQDKPYVFPDDFEEYITRAQEKFQKVKTLLYTNEPRIFEDLYVCSRLESIDNHSHSPSHDLTSLSEAATNRKTEAQSTFLKSPEEIAHQLIENKNHHARCVIMTGSGGVGKSMMLQHLMLESLASCRQTGQIPFFISLKNYTGGNTSLFEFICNCVRPLGGLTEDMIDYALSSGIAILLLNGLDEIRESSQMIFQEQLEQFTDQYPACTIIMSSRPYQDFANFVPFTTIRILPFTKEQAKEMINRLDFREDAPQIKEDFLRQLDEHLFESHKDFAENPLLLTIMLMTYEQYAEAPSKMRIFFREVYSVLSERHDNSKGAYKRFFRTGLSSQRLSAYLENFCALTWCKAKYCFSEEEFSRYFYNLKVVRDPLYAYSNEHIEASDFLYDLKNNVCLLCREGTKYRFIHRSLQGYFCALYFSRQMDSDLPRIGNYFEQAVMHSNTSEQYVSDIDTPASAGEHAAVFDMLYDMIPEKIEEYIFLPKLEAFLNKSTDENVSALTLDSFLICYILYLAQRTMNRPASKIYDDCSNIASRSIERMRDSQIYPEDLDLLRKYYEFLKNRVNTSQEGDSLLDLF